MDGFDAELEQPRDPSRGQKSLLHRWAAFQKVRLFRVNLAGMMVVSAIWALFLDTSP